MSPHQIMDFDDTHSENLVHNGQDQTYDRVSSRNSVRIPNIPVRSQSRQSSPYLNKMASNPELDRHHGSRPIPMKL
ncbi:hypothetical protein FZEAL_9657, partial [Fusarium zealandicum]